jgi:hypothetical protein
MGGMGRMGIMGKGDDGGGCSDWSVFNNPRSRCGIVSALRNRRFSNDEGDYDYE